MGLSPTEVAFIEIFDRVSLNIYQGRHVLSRAMQKFDLEEHVKEIYEAVSDSYRQPDPAEGFRQLAGVGYGIYRILPHSARACL